MKIITKTATKTVREITTKSVAKTLAITIAQCELKNASRVTNLSVGVLCLLSLNTVSVAAEAPSMKPKVEVEHRFLNMTNLKKEEGKFAFSASKISVSNLFASANYEQWRLDWRDVSKLPATLSDGIKKPVEVMHSASLGGRYMVRLNEQQSLLSGLGVSMTYESQTTDSLSVNGYSMVIHKLQNEWSIVYGGTVSYHPVQSRILPIAGFSYRMQKPLGWSGTLGFPRSYVAYGLSPKWQVSTGLVYNTVLAKLAKESVIQADGYGEIKAWQSDLAIKYQPEKHWSIQASLRYSPVYEFTTYNARGSRQNTFHMQPASGAALSASYQF